MEYQEVMPYKRVGAVLGKKHRSKGNQLSFSLHIAKEDWILLALIFGVGQASLFGVSYPFAFSILSAVLFFRPQKAWAFVLSFFAGAIVCGGMSMLLFYGTFSLLVTLSMYVKNYFLKKSTLFEPPAIAFLSSITCVVVGGFSLLGDSFVMYDVLLLILRTMVVFLCTYLFSMAMPVVIKIKTQYTREELIAFCVLLCFLLLSVPTVPIMGILNVRSVVALFVLLYIAHQKGMAYGTTTGIILGVIVGFSSHQPIYSMVGLAVGGLFAGLFHRVGKIGTALGLILSNAVLTWLLNGSTEVIIPIADSFLAVMCFCFLPKRYVQGLFKQIFEAWEFKKTQEERLCGLMKNRLNEMAQSFQMIENTFFTFEKDSRMAGESRETHQFIDRVANRVCEKCAINQNCWEKNQHDTVDAFTKILEVLSVKGSIAKEQLPPTFRARCIYQEDIVLAGGREYQTLMLQDFYQVKVNQNRKIVSEHFRCIRQVLKSMTEEMTTQVTLMEEHEKELCGCLKNEGYPIVEISVLKNENDTLEAEIVLDMVEAHTGFSAMTAIVSKVLGRKMVRMSFQSSTSRPSNQKTLLYQEEEAYAIEVGMTSQSKEMGDPCGDSYYYGKLKNGKFLVALSDGMGAGEKASYESEATVNLLYQLLNSGFDCKNAVDMLNSVLNMKPQEESYATLDAALIDLYQGKMELMKTGAAATFWVRPHKVEVLCSSNLPVGMIERIETDKKTLHLSDGDALVFVTDGVLDHAPSDMISELWFSEMLQKVDLSKPQLACEQLLALIEVEGQKTADDKTIFIANITKKNKKAVKLGNSA